MKKHKILLISPGLSREKQAGGLKDIANVLPTLGVGYIAALLERDNFAVRILDCIGCPMDEAEIMESIRGFDPDLIGITATILNINVACQLGRVLKGKFPKAVLAIGGPQFSSNPAETFEKDIFDFGVIGEGEITFLEAANALRCGDFSPGKIKGLVCKSEGKIIQNEPRPYISDLDTLPHPAMHLYPALSVYKPVPASYKAKPVGLMITSRGCPYRCIFCDRTVFGNKFRAHSPKYVVDEMELLINKFGAKEIRFMDDTFTMDPKRTQAISEEILKRGIKVPWTCLTRVDRVSLDMLKTMKRAGCWQVIYGLESGDNGMLERMKKGVTVEDNEKAVKLAKAAGLNVRATFVFGMPGESARSIKKTVNFAKKAKLDVVNFFTVILYPGNELFKIAKKEGKILHSDYEQYTSLIDPEKTHLHYVPEGMSEKELKNAIVQAYRDYYFRPEFVIRQALGVRGIEDINRYWQAFRSLILLRKTG